MIKTLREFDPEMHRHINLIPDYEIINIVFSPNFDEIRVKAMEWSVKKQALNDLYGFPPLSEREILAQTEKLKNKIVWKNAEVKYQIYEYLGQRYQIVNYFSMN